MQCRKYILILLFSLIAGNTAYTQTIQGSYNQTKQDSYNRAVHKCYNIVWLLVDKKDYKNAFELSSQLLNYTRNDSSNMRSFLTFINIISAARLVWRKQMTSNDFSKNAHKYIGQWVQWEVDGSKYPHHYDSVVNSIDSFKFIAYNILKYIKKDRRLQGERLIRAKRFRVTMLYEYFKFATPINFADFAGKDVVCGGILQSVEINPNKTKYWLAKLHIKKAFIRGT